jgi:nucleotide-binding universal stress UspA family protein
MEIDKILFPVDLKGSSAKIANYVIFMAKKFKAEVHVLFVVDTMAQYHNFYVPHPSLDQFELENIKRAERLLKEFAEEHLDGYGRVKIVVLRGNRVDQITKYADSAGIGVIIMATHAPHGIERTLFGSVVDEIIRNAPVPVLCINNIAAEKESWVQPVDYALPMGEVLPQAGI